MVRTRVSFDATRCLCTRRQLLLVVALSLSSTGCLLMPGAWTSPRADDPPYLSPYNRPLTTVTPTPGAPLYGAGVPSSVSPGTAFRSDGTTPAPERRNRVETDPSQVVPDLGAPSSIHEPSPPEKPRGTGTPEGNLTDELPVEQRQNREKPRTFEETPDSGPDDGPARTERVPGKEPAGGPAFHPPQFRSPVRVELAVTAPESCLLDDDVPFAITLTNTTDEPLSDIRVEVSFAEEFVFPGSVETRVGRTFERLAPKESKQFSLTLAASKPGRHCCRFAALEGGSESAVKSVCVEVLPRKLGVSVIGPSERFAGNRAEFNIKVANTSGLTQKQVRLTATYEPVLRPAEWTNEAIQETQSLSWKLGDMASGEGAQVQIEFDCLKASEETCLTISVSIEEEAAEKTVFCLRVAPADDTLAVDVSDEDDPVEVGKQTTYIVRVKNRGLQPAAKVGVHATVPLLLDALSARAEINGAPVGIGPMVEGRTVTLELTRPLPVDAELVLHIRVKATTIGDDRMRVTVTSQGNEDITVVEPTTVNPGPAVSRRY